jgi:hypothetical protein
VHLSFQATREARIRRIAAPGQPRQKKLARLHLNGKKLGVVAHTCHPSDGRKLKKNRRITDQTSLGKK